MEEWKKYKLRDLISYMSKGIVPVYTERKQDSVLVLNQKCNRDFKIDVSAARFHDSTLKKVPNNKVLKVGDILINSTGTGTAGRVAQVEYLENSMTVDGHMIILRNNEKITPIYLGYAIKQKQAMIEELAEGSTGQTEINKTRLLDEILIRFPVCHKEQNMIALILKNLDDKIALNKRINDNLFFTIILLLIKLVEVQLFMDYDKKSEETNKITMLKKEPQYTVWLLDLMNSKCFG